MWLGFALIALSATRADPDLWGHVRFGLDWLQAHTLPTVDRYSFTQDRPWINHEWLSEALMGAAYRAGGATGLVLLKIAVTGSALAVVKWRLRGSSPVVTASALSVAIVAALPLTVTMRPQVWSLLGLTIVVALVDTGREPTAKQIAGTAALFALWANVHGGWITGASALGAYALVRLVRIPRETPRWLLLLTSAAAGTLINPYGVGLWSFLAATVRTTRPDITEWQAFSLDQPLIVWVSTAAPLVIAGGLAFTRRTRLPLESWTVLLLLVAAGVRVSRVAPLIAPATVALLAPAIQHAWGTRARIVASGEAAARVLAIPALVAVVAAWTPTLRALSCIPISDSWAPDRLAAAQLKGATGRLWTTFDWGEYAIWHFGPELRVSIDGRRETVYSNDIVQWHRAFEMGDADARARFAAVRPEYVWLRANVEGVREWLGAHGYRIDISTDASFIGVRSDLGAMRLRRAPLEGCFP